MEFQNFYSKYYDIKNTNIIKSLGLLASFLGLLRFIPIVYEIYKTKRTNNFTPTMLFLALSSTIFWLIFGYYENTLPLIISSLIAFCVYIYIVYMKLSYK